MIQCNNHPNVIGQNLCIKCGKWYCNACMNTIIPEPICKNCMTNKHLNIGQLTIWQQQVEKIPVNLMIGISSVSILGFSILSYLIHVIFLLPLIILISADLFVLLPKFRTKITKNTKIISDAQVETALRITNNLLTIKLLSQKTNTDIFVAEDKLRNMYLDGKLEMDEKDGEIFYSNYKMLN